MRDSFLSLISLNKSGRGLHTVMESECIRLDRQIVKDLEAGSTGNSVLLNIQFLFIFIVFYVHYAVHYCYFAFVLSWGV